MKVTSKGNVEIRVDISQEYLDRWEALAGRRYGDSTQESLDRVAADACEWLLDRWDKGYYTLYDWFWSKVAFCPFKRLQAIGLAKLVFERYLS
jgi:hypothetical protein